MKSRIAKSLLWTGLLLAFVSIPACEKQPPRAPEGYQQAYQVKGVVHEVYPDKNQVRIAHEEIPGYMVAMTMNLDVKDPAELTGLQPGDEVQFRMVVTSEEGWIEQIRKTGATKEVRRPMIRRVREVEPLMVGDLIPEYRFTNELGKVVALSDWKGQALAITFIFTRCPYPNFCPRMTSNFADAMKQLKADPLAPTNWHMLSISFDPEFDSPAILQAYARTHGADPRRWNFLTGELIEVTAITEQFGLFFARPDVNTPNDISHNLRTVVLDTQGRVQRILTENEWKSGELAAEIIKAAKVPPK